MSEIQIHGGTALRGEVKIQGSKNAVLPILAATILIKGTCIIKNCPDISDVTLMMKLLCSIGCTVLREQNDIVVDAIQIQENRLPKEYVTGMRSSVMMMGALLGRTGEVSLDYPGGCVIGERPIDIHKEALERLGVVFSEREIGMSAKVRELTGTEIKLRFPSVGATENVLLASVLAKGTTVLYNCAKEPEIVSLARFLNQAGADICGAGSDTILIKGVDSLNPVIYKVESDRIVAGTYLYAVAAAGGEAVLRDAPAEYMKQVLLQAKESGCSILCRQNDIQVSRTEQIRPAPYLETDVYPGFPTDLQSMLLVVLSLAKGNSIICENIFNNRFRAALELNRMGADIRIDGKLARIRGGCRLKGRSVIAEDLRGGAALVIAGLCAQGDTLVHNNQFVDRGYEDICRDFQLLGANIRRHSEQTQIASICKEYQETEL